MKKTVGQVERAHALANASALVMRHAALQEGADAQGTYHAVNIGPIESRRAEYVRERDLISSIRGSNMIERFLRRQELVDAAKRMNAIPLEEKWRETIHNVVVTEGKNAALQHFLKGAAYTATVFMGLIESTGYGFAGANGSGVAATNLAASITAAGGASPANGWNEATSGMAASRGTPSFGTPSAGSVSLSAAVAFSILAAATIKGGFLIVRSAAGVASVATVGSTAGALWSAGLFTAGDKVVGNGDSLSVSYSTSL